MYRAALLLLLLPLTACAARTGGMDGPVRNGDPITAHISPEPLASAAFGGTAYSVYTDRPAYIAVFEVVPGRGVGMIYPYGTAERAHVAAGMHRVHSMMARTQRWAYRSTGYGGATELRYLFLIASELPMRLAPFTGAPWALHDMLGPGTFTAFNPYRTMETLVDVVLPLREWGGWTTDVYVQRRHRRPAQTVAGTWRVTCADGQVIGVPAAYLSIASSFCPDSTLVPEDGEGGPTADLLGKGYELRRMHPKLPAGIDTDDPFGTIGSARLESLRERIPDSGVGPGAAGTPDLPRLQPPGTGPERPRIRRPRAGQPRLDPPRLERPRLERPHVERARRERSRVRRPRAAPPDIDWSRTKRIRRTGPIFDGRRDAGSRTSSVRSDRGPDTRARRPDRPRVRMPKIDVKKPPSSRKENSSGSSDSSGTEL